MVAGLKYIVCDVLFTNKIDFIFVFDKLLARGFEFLATLSSTAVLISRACAKVSYGATFMKSIFQSPRLS